MLQDESPQFHGLPGRRHPGDARSRRSGGRRNRRGAAAAALLGLVVFLALFSWIYEEMAASGTAAQREALEQALDRAITSCYALEGMYPPDLEYMKEHYALVYDEDLFYVDYQPVAANIRPAYYIVEVSP